VHGYILPLLAALGCSLCNGSAAVLQKISADKEAKTDDLDVGFLLHLFQDAPYIIGVILDFLGWVLTVYAVQYLPLFLVEALIAANIVVTILVERIFLHGHMSRRIYVATGIILCGLVVLALSASPEKANPISEGMRWAIVLFPFLIGAAGYVVARSQKYNATIALAGLSGLAFGQTSVIGRIFTFSHPLWHTLYSPLILGLVASGVLGIWLFSTALQRTRASIANASMTAAQTLVPAIIGIVVLGDEPRNGLWVAVIAGVALVLSGVYVLAVRGEQ
jgi:drug/metabolite transporter (DMT)-like permease